MRNEVIGVHVGGAGRRLGEAFWGELERAHALGPEGRDPPQGASAAGLDRFFERSSVRWSPRAMYVAVEPETREALFSEALRRAVHPELILHQNADLAGNHARGRDALGDAVVGPAMDRIRRLAERCRALDGLVVTCALGGGSSGLAARIVEALRREYPEERIVVFALLPARDRVDQSPALAPYNALLATKRLADDADLVLLVENQHLHELRGGEQRAAPSWADLNRPLARAMVGALAPSSSLGAPSYDLGGLCDLLVRAPDQKFHALAAAARAVGGDAAAPEALTTDVRRWLAQLVADFERMYAAKAYVHHLVRAGLKEGELTEARARVDAVSRAYRA